MAIRPSAGNFARRLPSASYRSVEAASSHELIRPCPVGLLARTNGRYVPLLWGTQDMVTRKRLQDDCISW
jgi:hypothetical protein